jgi:hypothetical protein
MSRIILCGRVHLSSSAFARAQDLPMLEMFVVDPDDDVSAHPKGITAKELFSSRERQYRKWARNTHVNGSWLFGCSLHDDDWFNADTERLVQALASTKDQDEVDAVFAFVEWRKQLETAWIVRRGSWMAIESLPELPEPVAGLLLDGKLEEAERAIGSILRTLPAT